MIQCAECNHSFPAPETLEQHLLSNHAIAGTPLPSTSPTPPMSQEFLDTMKAIAEDKKKAPPQKQAPVITPSKPTQKQSLTLEYHYTGSCPSCGVEVTTLMADTPGGLYAIAYCLTDKQIEAIKVEDLPRIEQKSKIEKK